MGARAEVGDLAREAEPSTALAPVAETSSSAVAAREKAAVEARYLMAMGRPRNPDQARLRILDACKRPRFAETAIYAKPVGAKSIEGLSVRFAEEARRGWGNLDVTSMIVFDDAERRIYRVTTTDLETNASESQDVVIEKFVERSSVRSGQTVVSTRTNTGGRTVYRIEADEDALLNKVNAQISKARRNGILAMIPSDIREEAEEQVRATRKRRDAEDPAGARKRILDSFWSIGVTAEQVAEFIGKPLEQVNPAELDLLRSVYTAVKDGEATWADVMESRVGAAAPKPNGTAAKGTEGLKARIGVEELGAKIDAKRQETAAAKAAGTTGEGQ